MGEGSCRSIIKGDGCERGGVMEQASKRMVLWMTSIDRYPHTARFVGCQQPASLINTTWSSRQDPEKPGSIDR